MAQWREGMLTLGLWAAVLGAGSTAWAAPQDPAPTSPAPVIPEQPFAPPRFPFPPVAPEFPGGRFALPPGQPSPDWFGQAPRGIPPPSARVSPPVVYTMRILPLDPTIDPGIDAPFRDGGVRYHIRRFPGIELLPPPPRRPEPQSAPEPSGQPGR